MLVLSPAGPLILAFKYGPRIVHWLKGIWHTVSNPQNLVRAQKKAMAALHAAASFLQSVAGALGSLAGGLSTTLEGISKPLAAVMEVLGGTAILRALSAGIRWFAGAVEAAIKWVGENVPTFVQKVGDFFTAVWNWIKPILDVLAKVVMVVANPLGIPMLVVSWVWVECRSG